jgi:F-type H+-transporting ATPase subunit alpha
MPVEKQVVSIFAGTNGYLDEIPLEQVSRFEKELLELMELKHADILQVIAEKKDLSDETTEKLKSIVRAFTDSFKASPGA